MGSLSGAGGAEDDAGKLAMAASAGDSEAGAALTGGGKAAMGSDMLIVAVEGRRPRSGLVVLRPRGG